MSERSSSEPLPTLAGLRRRSRKRPGFGQADLFGGPRADGEPLFTAAEVTPLELSPEPPALLPESSRSLVPFARRAALSVSAGRTESAASAPRPSSQTGLSMGPYEVTEPALPSAATEPRTWTVSGLVRHVRGLVEQGYGQVTVEGEISNWRPAGSGHCYFTVKDSGAQLSAVLFRRQASLLRFQPADGDAVRLQGQLSIYENRGQMQLIVEWMEQVGLGALLAAVQRLKERLRREGLFDRKRPLPHFPRCIGVVTSLRGAALHDIVKVCRRRHAAVQMLIYPAAVQGPSCPEEVARGVRWFNAHPERAEVILIARGGGSWEDLHGFDDEAVVRAIAASALPVLTGIGHATDSTIADAAADLCASTPSAAAELLTADQHRIEERLDRLHSRLIRAGSHELLRAQSRFVRLSATGVLRRVQDGLDRRSQRIDELSFRSETALRGWLRRSEGNAYALAIRLERRDPTVRVASAARRLEALHMRLIRAMDNRYGLPSQRLSRSLNRLEALSPFRVLERGYALVYGPGGELLRDAGSVAAGQQIRARLPRGELRAQVLPASDAKGTHPKSVPAI